MNAITIDNSCGEDSCNFSLEICNLTSISPSGCWYELGARSVSFEIVVESGPAVNGSSNLSTLPQIGEDQVSSFLSITIHLGTVQIFFFLPCLN